MTEMINVETGKLRESAIRLHNLSANCNHRLLSLQETILWLREQEFRDTRDLSRALKKQYEELRTQKNELKLLSDALIRISDTYEKTEQRITEEQTSMLHALPLAPHNCHHVINIRPCITEIDLLPLINLLKATGIKTEA